MMQVQDNESRLQEWLQQRQNLIVAVFEIQLIPTESMTLQANRSKLECFCETMIDYISFGHFEIYHRLINTVDSTNMLLMDKINRILSRVQNSTDIAVSFNDQYEHVTSTSFVDFYRQNLSELVESLAERFEVEDLLIQQCCPKTLSRSLSA